MSLSSLPDDVLDGAFAASYDAKDFTAADYYGAEIRDRLTSVWSFVSGAISSAQRFPKFEARLNFSQSDAARRSVQQSAGAVADSVGGALMTGGATMAILALAAIAVYSAAKG